MESILGAFTLVAISEMGDKTQLLAFSLASYYKKPLSVMAGILFAAALLSFLASYFGSWISTHLPERLMAWILGLTFTGFGIWTLRSGNDGDEAKKKSISFGPFLTAFLVFFLAEMGDKTQLATVALSAKYQSVVGVALGATLGMTVSDGLAVFLGEKFSSKLPMKWIKLTSAVLFFLFGVLSFLTLFR